MEVGMKLSQNDMERIQDKLQQGLITIDEANVEMVKCERVRLISNKLPLSVRKALNKAVKDGVLGHMKKENYKPECYYFLPFKHLANQERTKAHNDFIESLNKIKKIIT